MPLILSQAVITKDGKLQLTITMENIHDLNWKSGKYIIDLH